VAGLAAASAWCVGLLFVRRYEFGATGHPWLVWNLFLAWVPLVLALGIVEARRHPGSVLLTGFLGVAWFLFLPNAPYVLTDFVHLGPPHRLYDALLIGSFAATSLALGFASIVLVQMVVTRAYGAGVGWAVATVSLFLSSIGIYLGRVHRLNSWDALTRPRRLLSLVGERLNDPLGNRYLILFVFALAGFLMLTYLGLYAVSALAGVVRDEPLRPTRREP
jgi:uncharacterized membrane protein